MTKHTFEAVLERPEGVGTWTMLIVPFDVEKAFGSKSQVKIKGTIDGQPIRSTLLPRGDGTHYLVVNRTIRDQIGKKEGDLVRLSIEPDAAPRQAELPIEFRRALAKHRAAKSRFERLPYSHQKQYVEYVLEAKRPETRERRIQQSIERLIEGK